MPDVDFYLTFLSDAQGLVDGGLSPYIAAGWSGADGSPSPGCYQFVTSSTGGPSPQGTETATQSVGFNAWTDWGIAAGGTVYQIMPLGFNYISPVVTFLCEFDIVDALGASILTSPLKPMTPAAPSTLSWASIPGGAAVGVNAGSQDAGTPIRFKMTFNPNNSGSLATTFKVDTIGMRVSYIAGSGGGGSGGGGVLPVPAPNGGLYLKDGTYIPGTQVCGAGIADVPTLLQEIRQGYV